MIRRRPCWCRPSVGLLLVCASDGMNARGLRLRIYSPFVVLASELLSHTHRRIDGRHHADGSAAAAAAPRHYHRDREPIGRVRQRLHRRGGKITADGNTWLAVFDNHAANPFVLPSLPYDSEKDLDPARLIGTAPYMITTAKAKPYDTLAHIIDLPRKSATSATVLSAAAALGIWQWRYFHSAPA